MAKNTDIIELKEGFTRNQSNISNEITNARTKMTALELKTFYQASTLIQMDDSDFKEYEISVSDFMKSLNISDTNREQVIKLCRRLVRQVFEIEQKGGDWLAYTIFSKMHYKHKEQKIAIAFNDEFRPFLLKLKQFTKIQQIKYIKNFESKYAIRFYAFLKDYRKMNQRDFNIEVLSKILELPKSITSSYTRLYEKVLKPAIKEINEKSDLWVSEPEIIEKKGKKITDFRLYFKNKSEQMADDFTEYLMERYKKFKVLSDFKNPFEVFLNCPYSLVDNPQTQNDLAKIKNISLENERYNLYIERFNILTLFFSDHDKNNFLKTLINNIYKAVNFLYENEKRSQLPTLQWQDKQDRIKRMKQLFLEWQKKSEIKTF